MKHAVAKRIGVSTSPGLAELKSFATLICGNAEVAIGSNRIFKITQDWHRRMPNASGYAFFLYLTSEVFRLSQEQREYLLLNPDVLRVISYSDPTGEKAVNRVMQERRRAWS